MTSGCSGIPGGKSWPQDRTEGRTREVLRILLLLRAMFFCRRGNRAGSPSVMWIVLLMFEVAERPSATARLRGSSISENSLWKRLWAKDR